MKEWQFVLLIVLVSAILGGAAGTALARARLRRKRDFTRRLETLLLPREKVKIICPGSRGRWILTSSRLIMETGQSFTAFPFSRIRKLSGTDEEGKTTTAPAKMAVLTVKTDREYTLRRKGEEFTDLARGLKAAVTAAKNKAKEREK